MPGKARRVASRQAQLNRKKRQQRGPSGIPAVEAAVATEDQQADEESSEQANGMAEPTQAVPTAGSAALATGETRAARPAGAGRLRREQVSSASYVVPELRRILIMGSVVLAVIIILGTTV
jgi:hypothetical protein